MNPLKGDKDKNEQSGRFNPPEVVYREQIQRKTRPICLVNSAVRVTNINEQTQNVVNKICLFHRVNCNVIYDDDDF